MPPLTNGSMAASPPSPRRSEPVGSRASTPTATCDSQSSDCHTITLFSTLRSPTPPWASPSFGSWNTRGHLDLDLPARQDRQLEGGRGLGRVAAPALRV